MSETRILTREREKNYLLPGVSDIGGVSYGAERRGLLCTVRRCVLNVLLKLQPYSRRWQVMSVAVRKNVVSKGSELKFGIYVTRRHIYFLLLSKFLHCSILKNTRVKDTDDIV